MFKTQTVLLGMAMVLSAAVAQAQGSALDAHRGALEDGSLGPFEAHLLEAMTPEQAEAFAAGEDPRNIVLEGGETLASFIASLLAGGQGLVYVPLDSCLVVRTVSSTAGKMAAGETRSFVVRGATTDLSAQGGSATGCLVPAEAVAVAMHFRVQASTPGVVGRLFARRTGGPGTPNRAMEYLRQGPEGHSGMSIIGLCEGACASGEFDLTTLGVAAQVRGDVVGFFRPIEAADIPGGISGGDADTLNGLDSTDFALVSHTHDGGAITSGTVGEPFIDPLITRDDEVVDIVKDNDGAGSGIDADLLDGRDSLDFALQVGNCLTVSASCPAAAADALAARCWQSINAALAEIGVGLPAASPTNRYVIKVGPGTYVGQVSMMQHVDIEGSGEKLTTITSNAGAAVFGADNAELRHLTVLADGLGAVGDAVAIINVGTSPMVKHVTLKALGGTSVSAGMRNTGSGTQPMLVHVTADGMGGGAFGSGVVNDNSASPQIRDSVLGGSSEGVSNVTTATASIVNTQILGGAGGGAGITSFTCLGAYDASFAELDANCQP